MRAGTPSIDSTRFRAVLGHFCTGITVVTTHDGQSPVGFACQSFAALSLDPPLVVFCPSRHSRTWAIIERTGKFAVNMLAEEQRDVCGVFGTPGTDKFDAVGWSPGPSGSPLLEGVLTWVECDLYATHEAGDHDLAVGLVTALGESSEGRPLLYYRGRYTATEPLRGGLGALFACAGPGDWL